MAVARIDPFWDEVISAVDFIGHSTFEDNEITVERNGRKASISALKSSGQIMVIVTEAATFSPVQGL